ncbi:MAG TPA: sarcosine oxidase subunit delta, partial [Planctomycetaceae bacterium]|nr:sarcosine oxidase subunit delta [Planctomycetaceae bacterium]
CRQWFLVQRDTRTNQVLDSVLPGAAIVGASESGASDE